MPIAAASIRAKTLKRWRARAWLGGVPVVLTALPTRTLSLLQARSVAGIAVRDIPVQIAAGRQVVVDISLDGQWTRYFAGELDRLSAAAAAVTREINASQAVTFDRALTTAITWSSRPFVDAVQDLLSAAGISSGQVDSIYNPGSDYALGATETITLPVGESLSSAWSELMEYGGTALVVLPSGGVRVVNNLRLPAATSQTIYADAATESEYGLVDVTLTIEPRKPLLQTFTARGPKLQSGAIPNGTYTATAVTGQSGSRQYRYLQTNALGQTIAEREVQRRAREQSTARLTAPLNPNLWPGDTILIRSGKIGMTGNIPAYVEDVGGDATGSMRVSLSLNASDLIGYASSVVPPIPDVALVVDYQLVRLAGTVQPVYLVQCVDQSHDPLGYAMTAWSWTASGPGAAPTSGSAAQLVVLFTDLAGASITLQVTSASGQSATITRAVEVPSAPILSRILTVAAGSRGWRVLDGALGWRDYDRSGQDCTAVPTFNERGPLLAGYEDGKIFASDDYLIHTPVEVADLGEAVACLFVNESNAFDILAGHGTTLSRSQDGGATWTVIWTGADSVVDAQSSPDRPDEIRLLAGNVEYLSYDGGANWAAAVTGAAGTTATMIATAPWGHAVTFDGTSSAADALRFEEGSTVNWSALAGGDQPAGGLTSVSALLEREGWIVGETSDLIRDGAMDRVCYSAGTGRLWLLTLSGAIYQPTLLPVGGPGSGAGKVLNDGASAYPLEPTSPTITATHIGYGPLMDRSYVTQCIKITNTIASPLADFQTAEAGGVWVNVETTWQQRAANLPAGRQWWRIAVRGQDGNDWLIIGTLGNWVGQLTGALSDPIRSNGEDVAWRTTNAGLSWTPVPMIYDDLPKTNLGVPIISLSSLIDTAARLTGVLGLTFESIGLSAAEPPLVVLANGQTYTASTFGITVTCGDPGD